MSTHETFFANYLDASGKLLELEQFREYGEGYLRNERTYFTEEAHPDLEREFLPLFAETFPPILHSSVIISAAILLEQELRGYAGELLRSTNQSVKFNDLAGTVLERFRSAVHKICGVDVDRDDVTWSDVVGVFDIRNCLVHANGTLADFSGAGSVRAFAQRHGTPRCDANRIYIDARTSEVVLSVISRFVRGIYAAALDRFPGPNEISRYDS